MNITMLDLKVGSIVVFNEDYTREDIPKGTKAEILYKEYDKKEKVFYLDLRVILPLIDSTNLVISNKITSPKIIFNVKCTDNLFTDLPLIDKEITNNFYGQQYNKNYLDVTSKDNYIMVLENNRYSKISILKIENNVTIATWLEDIDKTKKDLFYFDVSTGNLVNCKVKKIPNFKELHKICFICPITEKVKYLLNKIDLIRYQLNYIDNNKLFVLHNINKKIYKNLSWNGLNFSLDLSKYNELDLCNLIKELDDIILRINAFIFK